MELDELQALLRTPVLGSESLSQFLLDSVQLINRIDFSTFCLKNRLTFGFGFVLFFFPQNIHIRSTQPSVCTQGTVRFYGKRAVAQSMHLVK